MKGLHIQFEGVTTYLRNALQNPLPGMNGQLYSQNLQRVMFQILNTVTIIISNAEDSNKQLIASFDMLVKQLHRYVKGKPGLNAANENHQVTSDDQEQNDDVPNMQLMFSNADQCERRGDMYRMLSFAQNKQNDINVLLENIHNAQVQKPFQQQPIAKQVVTKAQYTQTEDKNIIHKAIFSLKFSDYSQLKNNVDSVQKELISIEKQSICSDEQLQKINEKFNNAIDSVLRKSLQEQNGEQKIASNQNNDNEKQILKSQKSLKQSELNDKKNEKQQMKKMKTKPQQSSNQRRMSQNKIIPTNNVVKKFAKNHSIVMRPQESQQILSKIQNKNKKKGRQSSMLNQTKQNNSLQQNKSFQIQSNKYKKSLFKQSQGIQQENNNVNNKDLQAQSIKDKKIISQNDALSQYSQHQKSMLNGKDQINKSLNDLQNNQKHQIGSKSNDRKITANSQLKDINQVNQYAQDVKNNLNQDQKDTFEQQQKMKIKNNNNQRIYLKQQNKQINASGQENNLFFDDQNNQKQNNNLMRQQLKEIEQQKQNNQHLFPKILVYKKKEQVINMNKQKEINYSQNKQQTEHSSTNNSTKLPSIKANIFEGHNLQDDVLFKKLAHFTKLKNVAEASECLNAIQIVHLKRCGKKCIHLNRFYNFLKKQQFFHKLGRKQICLAKKNIFLSDE